MIITLLRRPRLVNFGLQACKMNMKACYHSKEECKDDQQDVTDVNIQSQTSNWTQDRLPLHPRSPNKSVYAWWHIAVRCFSTIVTHWSVLVITAADRETTDTDLKHVPGCIMSIWLCKCNVDKIISKKCLSLDKSDSEAAGKWWCL